MYQHQFSVRVRYAETDQMGYLYYGHYGQYYEVARAEAMRSLGISYRDLEVKHHIMMPVMSWNIRYVRPAFYDDLLRMETTLRRLPDRHVTFYTAVFNQKNKLLNAGSVKLCFIDGATKKRISAPEYLLGPLRPFFTNKEDK